MKEFPNFFVRPVRGADARGEDSIASYTLHLRHSTSAHQAQEVCSECPINKNAKPTMVTLGFVESHLQDNIRCSGVQESGQAKIRVIRTAGERLVEMHSDCGISSEDLEEE